LISLLEFTFELQQCAVPHADKYLNDSWCWWWMWNLRCEL